MADPAGAPVVVQPPSGAVSTADVFTLNDAVRRYLTVGLADQLCSRGVQEGLVQALYRRQQLKLEYDATRTQERRRDVRDALGQQHHAARPNLYAAKFA